MIVFERLLDLIDGRPDGTKVDISALRRAFSPTHEEIVAAIHRLVVANRLDPATLRRRVARPKRDPSEIPRGIGFDAEPSKPLFDAIEAERQRRGLSRLAASLEIWGVRTRIYRLLDRPTCRAATARKIRAWLNSETSERPIAASAEPPRPRAAKGGGGAARHAIAPPPIDLDRLLECFSEENFEPLAVVAGRFGSSSSKIVIHAQQLRDRGLVESALLGRSRLHWCRKNTRGASGTAREASSAGESTPAERISDRAPIDPSATRPGPATKPSSAEPLEVAPRAVESEVLSEGSALAGPALEERKLRDPTKPPETPLMDLADRNSSRAQREFAARRRGQEAEAARLLDAGVDPASQSSFTANLMRSIQRRREDEARQADPVEQAKIKIRRKTRLPVHGAEWADPPGPKGHFFIGNRVVDEAELIRYAGTLGE